MNLKMDLSSQGIEKTIPSERLSFSNLSGIYYWSTTQTFDVAYIIGGRYTPNVVAMYKDDEWHRRDNLYQGRMGSGAITVGAQTMIIGGDSFNSQSIQTEIWKLDDEVYNITQPNLAKDAFAWGLALFEVRANYCKK